MLWILLAACGPTDKDSESPAGENHPPTAPLVAITPEEPSTLEALAVVIQGGAADPDGDDVSLGYAWFVDGADAGEAGEGVDPARTTKGETWKVVVTPSDGELEGEAAWAEVTILNSLPAASLAFGADVPTTADEVTAEADVRDADEDEVTIRWSWTRDGVDAGVTGPTLAPGTHRRGETWEVTAVPNDGEADGPAAVASFTVANALPTLGAVVLDLDAPTVLDTLTATFVDAADADGDEVVVRVDWYVDGVEVGSEEVGADEPSAASGLWVKGQVVRVVATPFDGWDEGLPVEVEVGVVDAPPSATDAHITPDPLTTADAASCVGEGWADPDGDSEGWQTTWTVNGVVVSTDAALPAGVHRRGDVVGCTLVPDDGELQGPGVAAAEVVVVNAGPTCVSTSVSIGPDPATIADTLGITAESSADCTDADGDTLSRVYDWRVDGVSAGSGPTLAGVFDRGQSVDLVVAWSDGTVEGGEATSNAVNIVNEAPVISALAISPAPAYTDDALSVTVATSDLEGDSVTLRYAWTVDGLAAGSDATLPASASAKGQVVAVTVTPEDGTDAGTPAIASLRIENSGPTAPAVAITPGSPEDADTLVCGVTAAGTDADGDSLSYTFAWTVGGIAYGGATTTTFPGDTVPASATTNGQSWSCLVTASDGAASAVGTATVVVGCDHDGDGYDATTCGGTDCDDDDVSRNPGAAEVCAGSAVDEDCDGLVDDADPSLSGTTWYPDNDRDGYGDADGGVVACTRPGGYLSTGDDCDDSNNQIKPGGTERCDTADLDEDCDGLADDADSAAVGRVNHYLDGDGDGYGDADAASVVACPGLAGYATSRTDCDDTDAAISPDAEEVCDDGIDNNCDEQPYPCGLDGVADENDAFHVVSTTNNVLGFDMGAGDFNGDGYRDWIADSYTYDRVHMFYGPFEGGSETEADDDVRYSIGNDYGLEVEGFGDVDGDGYGDFGALGTASTSRVYLLQGGPALGDTIVASTSAFLSFSAYGELAAAGDFDDDGLDGFWVADIGNSSSGDVDNLYLYEASSGTPAVVATWTGNTGYFGDSMIGGEDFDGDGVSDLILTSYGASSSGVYFLPGEASPVGSALTPGFDAWITRAATYWSVWSAGDINGDGWPDVAVGGETDVTVWFFEGPPTGTGLNTWAAYASGSGHAATAGDLDDDGADEVYVTNISTITGYTTPLPTGTLGSGFVTIHPGSFYSYYIREAEAGHDYSGDGIEDLLFGAYNGYSPQYVLLYTGGNL